MKQSNDRPYAEFGKRLRTLRVQGDITTQRELADRLEDLDMNYDYTVVSHWESGRRCPSLGTIIAIIKVLVEAGSIKDAKAANELLRLANMRSLNKDEVARIFGSPPTAVEPSPAPPGSHEVGSCIHIHIEPFKAPGERKPAQFPPEHLISRLEPIQTAIMRILQPGQAEQEPPFFQHVDRIIQYLAHMVELLPPDRQLNELETFTLLAAAHLHDIGPHFPHPESAIVLRERLIAAEEGDPLSTAQLVGDYYHELSWEWIENSLGNGLYPSLGLTSVDPVPEIALVCLGHRDANLSHDRYRSSGTGSRQMRPALLAALLSVADMLALASSRPGEQDVESTAPLEIQVSEWLHHYLERISIQCGHILFHYQLPIADDGLAVRVLLSGPIQLRLKELRTVLSENGMVIALDSSVTTGPVRKIPPGVLAHARALAQKQMISVIAALGQPSKPQILYHFTGLRGRPVLRWSHIKRADRYRCCLFDMQQHLIAQWETTGLEIALPTDRVKPAVQYEWITCAYRGQRQLRDWEGGIFWLVDEQTAQWVDRQIAWYRALAPYERRLTEGRILADYRLYEEAAAVFWEVLDHGADMVQLQARQELVGMYQDISRQLNRLGRPSRADQYLDRALILTRELQAQLERERLEREPVHLEGFDPIAFPGKYSD